MNKILTYFTITLFLSCTSDDHFSSQLKNPIYNNTLYYYNASENETLSLEEKLKAINQAFYLAKNRDKDTLLADVLYRKNFLHFSMKEYDSLLFYDKILINHATYSNDQYNLAKQFYLKAYYFDEVAHIPDSAFINYNLSKNHFQQIKNHSWTGKALLTMAMIQQDQNDFFGSKETITEALQYLHPKEDVKYIASSYDILATNHGYLLNYDDAFNFYNKAIKITLSEKDKLVYKNNLATAYIENKQYKTAITILDSISKDSLTRDDNNNYARIIDNLSYAKWLSGQNNTELTLLNALKIRIKNNDKLGQIYSYSHLGEFYSKNNIKKASSYFDSVIHLSKAIKVPRAEKGAIKILMQLYPKNIELRDRYVFLQDSLYEQELKVKTQFAKYKYDDKQKQESILRLQKEKAEKEVIATQERSYKLLFLFALIIALLITCFTIYFFKQRTKNLKKRADYLAQKNKIEKLEATYETEASLSRRVHDDFGGIINQAMMLIENNTNKTTVLDKLEGLYNQSRNFSREINEVNTGPNYKDELLGMMRTLKPVTTQLYITGLKDINWSTVKDLEKTSLYKVLQELMINMKKHSKATIISIIFKNEDNLLKINYSDDGIGVSLDHLTNINGLKNTENRIKAIGGTIIFDSEKGKGFKAQIQIPN
ncbi:hypothetical protein A8C32_13260 [Flavivirga aquatica]|uniref:Histidine kinase domain-containing protein n=1 Tax=Flavivirga aquatica TaxID=1849968 RepID=A0A1E5TE66_9FLAO|nr:hypothetical protein [Flavivirga aquatica]OEK09664.1 hypothetical protein A8C32_13260 [Flavivirga aquatica]